MRTLRPGFAEARVRTLQAEVAVAVWAGPLSSRCLHGRQSQLGGRKAWQGRVGGTCLPVGVGAARQGPHQLTTPRRSRRNPSPTVAAAAAAQDAAVAPTSAGPGRSGGRRTEHHGRLGLPPCSHGGRRRTRRSRVAGGSRPAAGFRVAGCGGQPLCRGYPPGPLPAAPPHTPGSCWPGRPAAGPCWHCWGHRSCCRCGRCCCCCCRCAPGASAARCCGSGQGAQPDGRGSQVKGGPVQLLLPFASAPPTGG